MNRLLLYTAFHANLSYSYIPEDLYPQILSQCYWPLLRIIDEKKVPLGLEFSGYTLEVINRLDPKFVEQLRELWDAGLCEVIGSGYVQSIMPLIPSAVNRQNLRLGNTVYQELLGKCPKVAYVNELVYSAGLPRLYHEAGYEILMVNWDSASSSHVDQELLYRPCAVSLGGDGRIQVIWHSLEAYRDFQQYVENQISLDTYMVRLLGHLPESGDRAFPLYSSDWEVFDFKPWRVYPEGFQQPDLGEMDRIAGLLTLLKDRKDIEFVTPSGLLTHFPQRPLVHPESSAYPLPYKKQDDHSVTRWAIGGRDNVRLNTQCHQLHQGLLLVDWYLGRDAAPAGLHEECQALWQELCCLWSSDYRTFTTEEKHQEFGNRMGAALDRVGRLKDAARPLSEESSDLWLTNCSPVLAEGEPVTFTITTNGADADNRQTYGLEFNGQTVPCQVTQRVPVGNDASRLTMEAVPGLAVGQAGPGLVRPLGHSSSREGHTCRVDTDLHIVETDTVRLRLLPQYGGAIDYLEFPDVSPQPVICRARRGALPSGVSTTDLISGDLALEDRFGKSITDQQASEIQYAELDYNHEIFVPVRCAVYTELGTIWKTYRVYLHQPRVDLTLRFQWQDVVPKFFRLGHMTLNPKAFDRSTLYCATTNGSEDVERFALDGQHVRQDEPSQGGVTARGCLGATEGWVALGDATKGIGFITRLASLYSAPLLHYEETAGDPEAFLLTLAHSLGEWDKTSHTLWRGHSTWSLSILGGTENIVAKTRASALLANGGLVSRHMTNSR